MNALQPSRELLLLPTGQAAETVLPLVSLLNQNKLSGATAPRSCMAEYVCKRTMSGQQRLSTCSQQCHVNRSAEIFAAECPFRWCCKLTSGRATVDKTQLTLHMFTDWAQDHDGYTAAGKAIPIMMHRFTHWGEGQQHDTHPPH